MHNLVVLYVTFLGWKLHLASAVFLDFCNPDPISYFGASWINVAFHVTAKLHLICKNSATVFTCPWFTDIVGVCHVLRNCRLWETLATLLAGNLVRVSDFPVVSHCRLALKS